MSLRESFCGRVRLALAVLLLVLTSSAVVSAQEAPPPKWDLFGGYSWYDPGATINGYKLKSDPKGFGITATYNFTKNFGISIDGAGHLRDSDSNQAGTVMVGPRLKWYGEGFQPFIHAMAGLHLLTMDEGVPGGLYNHKGPGARLGGGIDIPLSRRFSFRLLEGDYVWAHQNLYPKVTKHGAFSLSGAEVRSGIVVNFGGAPALPPEAMTCSAASPAAVQAGEPVNVSANVTNVPPKHTISYKWQSNGGKVEAKDNAATIDTNGLAPGQYSVTVNANDSKPSKNAVPLSCNASFTVNPPPPPPPPQISCSASPRSVELGGTSNISVNVGAEGKPPLNISYTASSGRVSGNNTSATLDTAGANPGPITVTATATDSLGRSATCNATVDATKKPEPPKAEALSPDCSFGEIDKKRTWRVDNTCKGVLDQVALRMQRDADAKLVIVGHADPSEKKADTLAAQRAANAKAYLTSGEANQQIDPSRIEVRTGGQTGKTASFVLVPPGATFDQSGTQPIDEGKVKAQGRKPAPPAHHKKAAPKQ